MMIAQREVVAPDVMPPQMPLNTIIQGDCLDVLRGLPGNSIDAIVTDPPAGISFMGKGWDSDKGGRDAWIAWLGLVMREALRVIKPGGHALVWALPRTSHWTGMALEDAGWDVRDRLAHINGQGFPKSLDVSKQLDSAERTRWLNVCKALDNNQAAETIMQAWKEHSSHAKSAELRFRKSLTATGTCMPESGSVLAPVLLSANPENSDASALLAELSSGAALPTSAAILPSAPLSVASNTTVLSVLVSIAASLPASHGLMPSTADTSAPSSAWGWLDASTTARLKGAEALKIWLGSSKSSSKAATTALCVALTDDLKRITLSRSRTFQSFDTTRQTACASAISATITESTAASLISFTVATLRSKAIDKAAGAHRTQIGIAADFARDGYRRDVKRHKSKPTLQIPNGDRWAWPVTAPASSEAQDWDGWGTALKPAVEDWWLCRKPLSEKTVAANVLRWGVGALNIEASRVESGRDYHALTPIQGVNTARTSWEHRRQPRTFAPASGRWPANLLLSHAEGCGPQGCELWCPVRELDAQSGTDKARPTMLGMLGQRRPKRNNGRPRNVYGGFGNDAMTTTLSYDDAGGASKFFATFRYQAKASRTERNRGCEGLEARGVHRYSAGLVQGQHPEAPVIERNTHPTVKPLALMSWLITLITPAGGIVLDPFAGSGSTLCAAKAGGWRYLGIEQAAEYVAIAQARLGAIT